MRSLLTLSSTQMQCGTTKMNSCELAVCCVSWMASHVGNNSTKFQITEYFSIILSFLAGSLPQGYPYVYGDSRKPTVKLYSREIDFSEKFEVPRLNCNRDDNMRGPFKSLYLVLRTLWVRNFVVPCFSLGCRRLFQRVDS